MAKKKPKKFGRPAKIGPTEQAMVTAVLKTGGSISDAAAIIGVDASTIRKLRARDKTFARGVKGAVAAGKMVLIDRVGNAPDWKAAAWMLERRFGKEFGRREPVKIEHTGANGGPIKTESEVTHAVDYDAIESELNAISVARRAASNN